MQTSALFRSIVIAGIVLWAMTPSPLHAANLTSEEGRQIATDAYIYGYSLITSDVTRAAFTNVKAPDPRTFQAPLNQFCSLPKYPPADYHGVTAPNADTLYSAHSSTYRKNRSYFPTPTCTAGTFFFPFIPSGPT